MVSTCRYCNQPVVKFTSRQFELLNTLAAAPAATNRELAETLSISERTVKKHLREIYHTIGARNRSECLMICLREGLIENRV